MLIEPAEQLANGMWWTTIDPQRFAECSATVKTLGVQRSVGMQQGTLFVLCWAASCMQNTAFGCWQRWYARFGCIGPRVDELGLYFVGSKAARGPSRRTTHHESWLDLFVVSLAYHVRYRFIGGSNPKGGP